MKNPSGPIVLTAALTMLLVMIIVTLVELATDDGPFLGAIVNPRKPVTDEPERKPAILANPLEEETADEAPGLAEVPVEAPVETAEPREPIAAEKLLAVKGRVIDVATGAGLAGCTVSFATDERARIWSSLEFFSSEADRPMEGVLLQMETESDGRFEFEVREKDMQEEAVLYLATAEGWVALEDSHHLQPQELLYGCERLFEAKAWPPPSAGNVTGWLRAEQGSFSADAMPRLDHILIDLVSTELPAIDMRATIEPHIDDEGGVTFSFLFEDVPEGEYNLTLSSLGNYRWDPTSIRVAPPVSGIEFLRFDLDEVVPLTFEVFDLESGDAIEDFEARHIKLTPSEEHGVLLHTGPIEATQFPRDQAFLWSVEADGYAVAYGDEHAFTEEKDGKRIARVGLKRGWSTRMLLMGGKNGSRPRPVAGGEVYLDGKYVGSSDANGGLVLFAEEAPEEIVARYPGASESFWGRVQKQRSNVTAIVMTEPE